MAKNKQQQLAAIADNRKARHDYFFEDTFEAGLELLGWEVKSIRAGRVQLKESYIILKNNEAWLFGAHISPLSNVPPHLHPDPLRMRKLLLHLREINKLRTAVQRQGYTVVPVNMHWKNNRVKLDIAIAKGKKEYDKREVAKRKEWEREKAKIKNL